MNEIKASSQNPIPANLQQECLEAASHRNLQKIEQLVNEHGVGILRCSGIVYHNHPALDPSPSTGTPLIHALRGRIFTCERGKDPVESDQDMFPVAKFLIENGCDLDGTDCYGTSALHLAVRQDLPFRLELTKLLLESGANPYTKTTGLGNTPIDIAMDEIEPIFEKYVPNFRKELKKIKALNVSESKVDIPNTFGIN